MNFLSSLKVFQYYVYVTLTRCFLSGKKLVLCFGHSHHRQHRQYNSSVASAYDFFLATPLGCEMCFADR